MFKSVITIAAIGISLQAYSQKVVLNWGEESKNNLEQEAFVRGQNKDLIKLCFEYKGKSIVPIISRFNEKLAEQAQNTFTVSEDNVKFSNFFRTASSLNIVTKIYDKGSKNTTYYCQPLSMQTLKPEAANFVLATFNAKKESDQTSLSYRFSKDSTKVLMFGVAPASKKETEKYEMIVLDASMKKLWSNTVELPYMAKYVDILSTIVTNDGKVGLIIKHFDHQTRDEYVRIKGEKVPSYSMKVLFYSANNSKPTEAIINPGKFIHSISLAAEQGDDITMFGLYTTKAEGNTDGFFTITLNKETNKVSNASINQFPSSLFELIENDKQGSDSKRDPGLGGFFEFNRLVTRENGDKDFLLEYSFVRVVQTKYGTTRTYYYGDIIDINLKSNGQIAIARIPKLQMSSSGTSYMGFEALPYKDKLLLFYNDDIDNINKDLSKKPEELKFGRENASFVMTTVSPEGNVDRKILIDKKQTAFTVAVNSSFRIGPRKIALYSMKGGLFSATKDMIGTLEVE